MSLTMKITLEGEVIHQWSIRVDVDVNNDGNGDGDGNIDDDGDPMGIVW